MKCKDFHIEVEDGLKGESLSIAGQSHTADCRPCREFYQKHVEFREWLMVCEQITAPKDFQFGVQRKIANGNYAHSHGWAWNRLRYIVPATALTAILVLAGFYTFNTRTATNTGSGVATLDANVSDPSRRGPDEKVTIPGGSGDAVDPAKKDEEIASANKQENSRVESTQGGTLDSQSTRKNIDSAVIPVEPPKMPEGINPKSNSASADRSKTLIAMQKLGAIAGVADLKIKQVLPKTPAERAGIKAGDVVESVSGNIVTVKRGGQILQITVQ